jgi:hypothetical protein
LAQVDQPYPPLNLVNIPTAGTLPRGSFTLESLIIKNGGIVPRLSIGFTDNFTVGVSYGVQNLIGDTKPSINKTTPEVQIKYRIFDESEKMPALVYGLDTQGRGQFHKQDSILSISGKLNSTRTLNRYDQKAWGMYIVFSKNWNLMGNLGMHAGISKSLSENNDGDKDLNVFFGFEKERLSSLSNPKNTLRSLSPSLFSDKLLLMPACIPKFPIKFQFLLKTIYIPQAFWS